MTEVDAKRGLGDRMLGAVERVGNKLPDPAMLFVGLLVIVWLLSWWLSTVTFEALNPKTGAPVVINNLMSGEAMTTWLGEMVTIFSHFHPVGIVLVAMLGIGVAEHTGFINTGLRALLAVTAKALVTPLVIAVGIMSHAAADAGYVLVIPLGGVIFYAAGRHPLAGIAAAFAGVSGGFSANFIPSSIDPMLASLTQEGARIFDASVTSNPLNNFYFTASSSVLIIAFGWWVTEKVIEPRLKGVELDGELDDLPTMDPITEQERKGLWAALAALVVGVLILVYTAMPEDSVWRDPDSKKLTDGGAALMKSIVPLIFFMFALPGIVYGIVAKTISSSKDVIDGMTKAMHQMAYYLVIMFFIAQFVYAFNHSNLGLLLALKGAEGLQAMGLAPAFTLVGIILLTAFVNLFVGSASGKWGVLGAIFVPMLMGLGLSPDLTQAAYRIGDSSTNIITPLMPYFPLVVVYCQRYVKTTGIGTLTSLMLPYSLTFLAAWSAYLIIYYTLGFPLGVQASYTYP